MSSVDVKEPEMADRKKPHEPEVVFVKVVTTSGSYPRKGYEEVRIKEHVSKFLREAAHALHLTDVDGWVAIVDGRVLDPGKTFAENGLTGEVSIQWGPPEGGGGCILL